MPRVAIVPQSTIVQEVNKKTLAEVKIEGDFHRPLAAISKKTKVLLASDEGVLKCSQERCGEPRLSIAQGVTPLIFAPSFTVSALTPLEF